MVETSQHRPLTGSGRTHSSVATVHSIGSGLTVISTAFFAIVVLCSLVGLPGGSVTDARGSAPYAPALASMGSRANCNPYALPGFVSHEPYPAWQTYDPECSAPTLLPDLLSLTPGAKMGTAASLRSQSVSKEAQDAVVRAVKNRTVVLVGDAVDRTLIQDLCGMFHESPVTVDAQHPWGSSLKFAAVKAGKPASSDALLADYCYLPEFSTLFTSFYHYGADTDELWRNQLQYSPPGRFEDRLTELLQPYLKAMATQSVQGVRARSSRPDLVVFSSSLWDLAAWAMDDDREHLDATGDLSQERLKWWRTRQVDMLEELRKQLGPNVPIAWRSAHIPTTTSSDTVEQLFATMHSSTASTTTAGHVFALPNRLVQLNQARRSMLPVTTPSGVRGQLSKTLWTDTRQPGLHDLPWGEVTLGQTQQQSTLLHPGLESHTYLFWSMVLAALPAN